MHSPPLAEVSEELATFATTARGFCDWCEGAPDPDAERSAAYWLARLYADALHLPQVGPENDCGIPAPPADALDKAKAKLSPFWGWYYREVLDPAPELSDEPGMGDLGDDLMDIYRDIRAGLVLFDEGRVNDALWHWSFMHRNHWGQHATGALWALHRMSISKTTSE